MVLLDYVPDIKAALGRDCATSAELLDRVGVPKIKRAAFVSTLDWLARRGTLVRERPGGRPGRPYFYSLTQD